MIHTFKRYLAISPLLISGVALLEIGTSLPSEPVPLLPPYFESLYEATEVVNLI